MDHGCLRLGSSVVCGIVADPTEFHACLPSLLADPGRVGVISTEFDCKRFFFWHATCQTGRSLKTGLLF